VELNIGQYLDLSGTATGGVDCCPPHRPTEVRPLHDRTAAAVGAPLGDRPDPPPSASTGDPLGEAFQLRDDVLGVFGLEQRTGKPVGDDLREGKPTLMLAVAHERADDAQRELLGRVGEPDLDDQAVADLQALFIETGALDVAETEIAALAGRAVAALPAMPLPPHADLALRDLAAFVVARDA
jgi:geranylgeranyl diphosphate synthase type I